MFTIDLLKGQGVPIRCRPAGIVIGTVAMGVPVLAAVALIGLYLHTKITISVEHGRVVSYRSKIARLAEPLKLKAQFEQQKQACQQCLCEVQAAIRRHMQWSDLLVLLAEKIPENLSLKTLEVQQQLVKRNIPSKDDPEELVEATVPVKTIRMTVYGAVDTDTATAVRQLRDALISSATLGPRLEHITVSQRTEQLNGRDVVLYEIDCLLKPVI